MTRPCVSTGCGAQVRALAATDTKANNVIKDDGVPPAPSHADRRRGIARAIEAYMRTNASKPERPRPWNRRRAGR